MLDGFWTQVIGWSGAVVAPDWGALVALIPLLLLLVVVAFIGITGAKWAAVVPSRSDHLRQRQPLTPDGRPLRTPVLGPLLLAAGVFALAFGLLAGPVWLATGAIAGVTGLAAWSAERRHGPGLRVPRVSRRRLVILAGLAILAGVLVATAKVEPDSPRAAGVAAPGAVVSPAAMPSADAALTARGIAFAERALAAPAGHPFTVAFDNQDSVPHNLEIRDANGSVVFRGDVVTGPVVKVYDVPTLPAGTYQFICTVHPAMTGTLTAK